jgi:hypothetical protein
MPETPLLERLAAVREAVAAAQLRGGWPTPPAIVAVTKTHGVEVVRAAVAAGLEAVGENRVGEAVEKQEQCADLSVAWHFIGTLQRRKAKTVAGRFALIHSVDRLDLAEALDRRVADGCQPVLVQVNCSDEPQKGGVAPGELPGLLDALRALARLEVRGLMTMAALDASGPELHATFGRLRGLRDAGRREGHDLPELSMGMSDDYPIAVEEGATMLRLGSALFGPRPAAP